MQLTVERYQDSTLLLPTSIWGTSGGTNSEWGHVPYVHHLSYATGLEIGDNLFSQKTIGSSNVKLSALMVVMILAYVFISSLYIRHTGLQIQYEVCKRYPKLTLDPEVSEVKLEVIEE